MPAATFVGTNVLPQFFGVPARTIRIHVAGAADTSQGGTLQFQLYGGDGTTGSGILLGDTGAQTISYPNSKGYFSGIIYLTVYTTDTGGTCRVGGQIIFGEDGNTARIENFGFGQTSDTTFNTGITHTLMLYNTFNTVKNKLTFNIVNIEVAA